MNSTEFVYGYIAVVAPVVLAVFLYCYKVSRSK